MKDNYTLLDKPEILVRLFYPRPEYPHLRPPEGSQSVSFTMSDGVALCGYFHIFSPQSPTVLFFHGNGEIAADYHDIALMFKQAGANLLVIDYRGYGRSGGLPSVSSMMRDSNDVFNQTLKFLEKQSFSRKIIVYGRSLGSISALEIASVHQEMVDALVVESGFAHFFSLLRVLGLGELEKKLGDPFKHTEKIALFKKPTLIIHAQYDHIIPFSEGETLFQASGALDKVLIKIMGANHNDIFFVGMGEYLRALTSLVEKISS
ncbi:MAG: alpha/beta fold hydrolase [Syntrophales bacterium]|nr:alpha/beta fold hydrolase [Syntrophales bacterium]